MEATSLIGTRNAAQASPQQNRSQQGAGDFETFLTLLTTQLKNQDPLKPLDSTEFVAQLASFSAVEQQIRTNDSLDEILRALTTGASSGLADWVGKEVRTDAGISFDGSTAELSIEPALNATRVQIVIETREGIELNRFEGVPGQAEYLWDGSLASGAIASPGSYRARVIQSSAEGALAEGYAWGWSKVVEVRLSGGEASLLLENGSLVSPQDMTAVRAAAA